MVDKVADARLAFDPGPSWVPLSRAPFFFGWQGGAHLSDVSRSVIERQISQAIKAADGPPSPYSTSAPPPEVEWRLEIEDRTISVFNAKLQFYLRPYYGEVGIFPTRRGGPAYVGTPEEFLNKEFLNKETGNDVPWNDVSEEWQHGVEWHWRRGKLILNSLASTFSSNIQLGRAHIMARHEILGPFERVHYDQWQYLTLDDPPPLPPDGSGVWFDPRLRADWWTDRNPLSTATGPSGERLYSIYVAPGESTPLESSASIEEKCLRLLQKIGRDFPEHCPMTVDQLRAKVKNEIPELTKTAFNACLFRFRGQAKRTDWIRRGRPEKPSKKTVSKNKI